MEEGFYGVLVEELEKAKVEYAIEQGGRNTDDPGDGEGRPKGSKEKHQGGDYCQ